LDFFKTLINALKFWVNEKFTLPNIQTAQVGQTVVVKAVDETGKPTEWEAKDCGAMSVLLKDTGEYVCDKSYQEVKDAIGKMRIAAAFVDLLGTGQYSYTSVYLEGEYIVFLDSNGQATQLALYPDGSVEPHSQE